MAADDHPPGSSPARPRVPDLSRRRDSAAAIHARLRSRILADEIPAGSELVQAQVAKEFGVSRGPVREAFRLLQREGIIDAEVNLRARVASLSLQELEHLYAMRVVNEALALWVSAARLTDGELDDLDRLASAIGRSHPADFAGWEAQHQAFHSLLVSHAGERMRRELADLADHTSRYRRVYVIADPGVWLQGAHEHGELAGACRARDATSATALLARHLSRAALTVIAGVDPAYDPALLRAAVRQATAVEAMRGGGAPRPDRPLRDVPARPCT